MMMSRKELDRYLDRLFEENAECFKMLAAGEEHLVVAGKDSDEESCHHN